MPGANVFAERSDDAVEHLFRDVVWLQREFEWRSIPAGVRVKDVPLDPGREVGGHRVLHREVGIGIALKSRAADMAVGAGKQ